MARARSACPPQSGHGARPAVGRAKTTHRGDSLPAATACGTLAPEPSPLRSNRLSIRIDPQRGITYRVSASLSRRQFLHSLRGTRPWGAHKALCQRVPEHIAAGASVRDAGHRQASADSWAAFNLRWTPAQALPVGTAACELPDPGLTRPHRTKQHFAASLRISGRAMPRGHGFAGRTHSKHWP